MIRYQITADDISEAAQYVEKIPANIRNSVTSGGGRLAGTLGEIAARNLFRSLGLGSEITSDFDYDLRVFDPDHSAGAPLRMEVKTALCRSEPRSHYECNVSGHNAQQQCDHYLFARYDERYQRVYLLGYLPRDDFHRKARFKPQGTTEGNMGGGSIPATVYRWPLPT